MSLSEKVAEFPASPGVYLMKDAGGHVIYVGKAIDLKKRVLTYLKEKDDRYQVRFLMKRTADVEYIVTDSEKEALLLENTLIKKHRPRYNIQLKDDKSYASIKLSLKDKFPRIYVTRTIKKDGSVYFGPYASAKSARETVEFIEKYFRLRTCSDAKFANRVRPCLQYQIHRCDAPCVGLIGEARYRTTVEQVKLFLQGRKKDLVDVLEGEMKEQSEREEFEKAARTRDLIASIRETLEKQNVARHQWIDQDVIGVCREGDRMTFCLLMVREGKIWESLLYHLKGQGEDEEVLESFLKQFYDAVDDQCLASSTSSSERRAAGSGMADEVLLPYAIPSLEPFSELLSERRGKAVKILIPQRGDRSDLTELASRNAREGFQQRAKKSEEIRDILADLQETLGLQNFPRRIECFDISNTNGEEAVGSLVCFVDGSPSKEGYRRFKIKTVEGPNDYAMMQEVLKRRLLRADWERPDLIVADGGKGQLNSVLAIMEELNITGIDVIALAKKKEGETQDKVFLPGRKNPLLPGRHSGLLHLLMSIRDEAHRFAITYHRKLRVKKFLAESIS